MMANQTDDRGKHVAIGQRIAKTCSAALAVWALGAVIDVQPAMAVTYFEYLSGLSTLHAARSYRNQTEINEDLLNADESTTVYDPVIDAARFVVPEGLGSIFTRDQIRYNFPVVETGNVLYVWEARWSSGFTEANETGLSTFKAFQVARGGSPVVDQRIEIRQRFDQVADDEVSRTDVRRYLWQAEGVDQPLPNQANQFIVRPEVWTRYWAYVDFDSLQFSLWAADETRQPVKIFDNFQFTQIRDIDLGPPGLSANGVSQFWFEFNTSQSFREGPDLNVWGRNVVILRDVDDPQAIVDVGAFVTFEVDVPAPADAFSVD